MTLKPPNYDPEALRKDIEREEQNIELFFAEIKKSQERKMQLEILLQTALKG